MTCGSCSDKVKASLKGLEGVILVALIIKQVPLKSLLIIKKIDVKTLEKTLVDSGYKLVEKPSNRPYEITTKNWSMLQLFSYTSIIIS